MSIFGTPSSTSSLQSLEQPPIQALLSPLMVHLSHIRLPRSQIMSKPKKTVEARIFGEIRRSTHQNVERFLFKYLREDLVQGVARLSIKLYKKDIRKDDGSTFLRLQYKMRSANEPGAYFTSTTRDLKGGKIRP